MIYRFLRTLLVGWFIALMIVGWSEHREKFDEVVYAAIGGSDAGNEWKEVRWSE